MLWGLADKAAANSLQLGIVAESSRAERLQQNGCTINGQVYHPQVWTPQQAHGVDLLIVSLKYGALPGALDSAPYFSEDVYKRQERGCIGRSPLLFIPICLLGYFALYRGSAGSSMPFRGNFAFWKITGIIKETDKPEILTIKSQAPKQNFREKF